MMRARSQAALLSIEHRLDRIMQAWLLGAGLLCALRIATSPINGDIGAASLAPFILLIVAPFASMVLALRWFAAPMPQTSFRFARAGRWIDLRPDQARRHRLYGTGGIMLSLMIGMLLNVPVRSLEFLAAVPALPDQVPGWLDTMRLLLTFDVVLLSSLYVIAFVAALRKAPLFPKLLVAIWCIDVTMQLVIANLVASKDGLPPTVAAALGQLLDGNVTKVMVSAAIWLPYLMLSKRVNVTFRHRIAA